MLKGITVNTAPEAEPHIFAEDDAAIYQSIFGSDGVFNVGSCLKPTVLSNNKVRIADGVVCVGGHMCRQPYAEYQDMEIVNGQTGKNRNDIIVAKFVTTGTGGVDTFSLAVVQGAAGTTAADPAITQDNIYAAGKIRELPLYRVKIEGLSIVKVEQLFTVIPTIPELKAQLNELNSALKDYIKIVEVTTASVTIPANNGKEVPKPSKSVEGYKYLTTISAAPNGDASVISQVNGWSYNHKSSAITISVTYTYLYVKL